LNAGQSLYTSEFSMQQDPNDYRNMKIDLSKLPNYNLRASVNSSSRNDGPNSRGIGSEGRQTTAARDKLMSPASYRSSRKQDAVYSQANDNFSPRN
jgi:hypothetical protein